MFSRRPTKSSNSTRSNKRKAPKKYKPSKPRGPVVASGKRVDQRRGTTTTISKKRKKSAPSKSLRTRLNKLEKEVKGDLSYFHWSSRNAIRGQCDLGKAGWQSISAINSGFIRQAVDLLPIGTGVPIDGTAVAENTQLSIRDVWGEAKVCNATDSPCHVTIYALSPVTNTADSPLLNAEEVASDMGYTWASGASVDLNAYPVSFPDFRKIWKVIDTVKGELQAGDSLMLSASIPDFKWSDDLYDNHSFLHLKGKGLIFLVRQEGGCCFDSANSARISTFPNTVLIQSKAKMTVCYPGNVSGRTYEFADNLGTASFTGTPTIVGPNVIDIVG